GRGAVFVPAAFALQHGNARTRRGAPDLPVSAQRVLAQMTLRKTPRSQLMWAPIVMLLILGFGRLDSPLAGAKLFTLDNGLRVLVREQHDAPLVAIDLWIRAGSSYEQPDENGAAHFLEHVIFKGTSTRKKGEIDAAFEDVGS